MLCVDDTACNGHSPGFQCLRLFVAISSDKLLVLMPVSRIGTSSAPESPTFDVCIQCRHLDNCYTCIIPLPLYKSASLHSTASWYLRLPQSSFHLAKEQIHTYTMAEPIPSASNDTEETGPTNAEDRKAAAALDSLNANDMSQENGEGSGSKQPTAADQEALGKAMARLEGVAGGKSGAKKVESKGDAKGAVSKKKEEETKKKVKIDAGDVQFLVS